MRAAEVDLPLAWDKPSRAALESLSRYEDKRNVRLTNTATTQTQNQCYELAHSKIHPIYNLLEKVKDLQIVRGYCTSVTL